MFLHKKDTPSFIFVLISCFSLLALQFSWIYTTYTLKQQELIVCIEKSFELAYQKEQTYRVPVIDIMNPGAVTIESCGNEEVHIIRNCPVPDTVIYNNLSGHSIEQFMNRVFGDLRERIVPMNIYCMADLFAGLLHDADIPVVFVIERFNTNTGELLETSSLPDKKQPNVKLSETVTLVVSESESLRGIVQLTPNIVFGRMTGTLIFTTCLIISIICCIWLLYRSLCAKKRINEEPVITPLKPIQYPAFQIGQYHFDPGKNELNGFGESIQLNKKENAILHALCIQRGNVVERHVLLQENWGNSGIIYSRSLDTYLTTLRKYFKKDPSIQIVTVKGVGYKLVY